MDEIVALSQIDYWQLLFTIVKLLAGFAAIGGLLTLPVKCIKKKFNIETKHQKEMREQKTLLTETVKKVERLENNISEFNKSMESLRMANMAVLADRINQKYKYYLKIKGIPEDEFDEFVQLHDAYKGVGGNHTIDEKYEKAMKFRILMPQEMMDKGIL